MGALLYKLAAGAVLSAVLILNKVRQRRHHTMRPYFQSIIAIRHVSWATSVSHTRIIDNCFCMPLCRICATRVSLIFAACRQRTLDCSASYLLVTRLDEEDIDAAHLARHCVRR